MTAPWSIILHCMTINAIMVWHMRLDSLAIGNFLIFQYNQSIFMVYCARQGMCVTKGD